MDKNINSDQIEKQAQQYKPDEIDTKIQEAAPASDNLGETVNIDLERINPNEINSPGDFRDPEKYVGMRREAEKLKQMQPAIEQGADVETFHEWDKANQIGQYSPDREHIRGYADAYHSYYDGQEPVILEPRGDGTYDVGNGRHRVFVCREAGIKSIPVKILR